jgi:mannosyltransferase OCH1-like enzyme
LRARWERRFGVPAALDSAGISLPEGLAGKSLPKRIWIYWQQGWSEAPEIVQRCRRSWEERNPGWEVVALDAVSAAAWSPASEDVAWRDMRRNHQANFLRLDLLAAHGGVWVDATTFCGVPLDAWLPALTGTGFFAFARPGKDRLLSTWFLAAAPGNPLLLAWRAHCRRYARMTARADFYFWFPYLFADLCRGDPAVRLVWKTTPKVSADPSHAVQWSISRPDRAGVLACRIAADAILVHKLDWRLELPPASAATPLALLLRS